MGVPVIDLKGLDGENRKETMALLKDAAERWGFFQIVNHGMPSEVMNKMKTLARAHLGSISKKTYQESEIAEKVKEADSEIPDVDWETCFFVQHLPTSNLGEVPDLPDQLQEAIEEYSLEAEKLGQRLLELFDENLRLEKGTIKKEFSGCNGPFLGTKFAQYPSCPRPELVMGLRKHSDAGGVIIVLQDDQIPGLQFLKDGKWVDVVPLPDSIFVNTGEQLEVVTNGRIKSIPHQVIVMKEGGRLSIASFYNPASDAVIKPVDKLVYPKNFKSEDYMKLYSNTKFGEKELRFETMRERIAEPRCCDGGACH